MKTNKLISAVLLFAMLLSVLSGCGDSGNSDIGNVQTPTAPEGSKSVKVLSRIPEGEIGVKYNVSKVIMGQRNVEYSATAYYLDESGKQVALEMEGMSFVPQVSGEVYVAITGTSETDTYYSLITVPIAEQAVEVIKEQGDALELLLSTRGVAGDADEGVLKSVVNDSQFFKAEGSTSSLKVEFKNPDAQNEGTSLLLLSHYALMAYYNARIWKDAVVTFWVHNPMPEDVELKLTAYNPKYGTETKWDSPENTQSCIVKAGEWTQAQFSLYKMGIDTILFNDELDMREDELKLCARYNGSDVCTLYFDGIDVVHAKSIGMDNGAPVIPLPEGNFDDILADYPLSTNSDAITMEKTKSVTHDSDEAVVFYSKEAAGRCGIRVDFGKEIDIRGFDAVQFAGFADTEKTFPSAIIEIIYIDEEGNEAFSVVGNDTRCGAWREFYVNLARFADADLSRVVGIRLLVYIDEAFAGQGRSKMYYDNLKLVKGCETEPLMPTPIVEDDDLISGPLYAENFIPDIAGVTKVAYDETGAAPSNSILAFWTNATLGYPCISAKFMFDEPQDWSQCSTFSFDSHTYGGHYLYMFEIYTMDEDGNIRTATGRHDTVLTNWLTTPLPLSWFSYEDGSRPDVSRVIGLKISVDMAVNVTREVAHIYVDNVKVY